MKKTVLIFTLVFLITFIGLNFIQILSILGEMAWKEINPEWYILDEAPVPAAPVRVYQEDTFEVYVNEIFYKRFDAYDDALAFAQVYDRAGIRMAGRSSWLWDNYPPYLLFLDGGKSLEYDDYGAALQEARQHDKAEIYYRKNYALLWSSSLPPSESHAIQGVEWIGQYPELPRGCEVTSLAMLLRFAGVEVDKLTLADEIRKDPTPYRREGGRIYAGSPFQGFVGDMYNVSRRGLGVYHGPIYELLKTYLPNHALDLTGAEFEDLLYFVSLNSPVWIITNTTFQRLGASSFETWHTVDGELQITYREHSILITGYDSEYIYFLDPMSSTRTSAQRSSFQAAWEQMGRQAVTISP